MILTLIRIVAVTAAISLMISLGLILSQWPAQLAGEGGLDFENTLAGGGQEAPPTQSIHMRDGYALQVRRFASEAEDAPLVVLVHGSGWHGLQLVDLAQQLSATADVVVPDLRGHGAAPGRRGDVDYIGQFEDDLADLITATRKAGQRVVLAGHSSGGGLAVRFAGGEHGDLIEGAVLLAPFLHHNAPTMRPNAGGWAHVLLRRIIGLSMLNSVGITALNNLVIVQFDMPKVVLDGPLGDTATTAYTFRLNTGFAPRGDYLSDVAALPPFLLIAGQDDEAFVADQYQPVMSAVNDTGQYLLVDGVNHLDIINAPQTAAAMKAFLHEF